MSRQLYKRNQILPRHLKIAQSSLRERRTMVGSGKNENKEQILKNLIRQAIREASASFQGATERRSSLDNERSKGSGLQLPTGGNGLQLPTGGNGLQLPTGGNGLQLPTGGNGLRLAGIKPKPVIPIVNPITKPKPIYQKPLVKPIDPLHELRKKLKPKNASRGAGINRKNAHQILKQHLKHLADELTHIEKNKRDKIHSTIKMIKKGSNIKQHSEHIASHIIKHLPKITPRALKGKGQHGKGIIDDFKYKIGKKLAPLLLKMWGLDPKIFGLSGSGLGKKLKEGFKSVGKWIKKHHTKIEKLARDASKVVPLIASAIGQPELGPIISSALEASADISEKIFE